MRRNKGGREHVRVGWLEGDKGGRGGREGREGRGERERRRRESVPVTKNI